MDMRLKIRFTAQEVLGVIFNDEDGEGPENDSDKDLDDSADEVWTPEPDNSNKSPQTDLGKCVSLFLTDHVHSMCIVNIVKVVCIISQSYNYRYELFHKIKFCPQYTQFEVHV